MDNYQPPGIYGVTLRLVIGPDDEPVFENWDWEDLVGSEAIYVRAVKVGEVRKWKPATLDQIRDWLDGTWGVGSTVGTWGVVSQVRETEHGVEWR